MLGHHLAEARTSLCRRLFGSVPRRLAAWSWIIIRSHWRQVVNTKPSSFSSLPTFACLCLAGCDQIFEHKYCTGLVFPFFCMASTCVRQELKVYFVLGRTLFTSSKLVRNESAPSQGVPLAPTIAQSTTYNAQPLDVRCPVTDRVAGLPPSSITDNEPMHGRIPLQQQQQQQQQQSR